MECPTVRLEIFKDQIDEGDPDANFKEDVALYSRIDPMPTLGGNEPEPGPAHRSYSPVCAGEMGDFRE